MHYAKTILQRILLKSNIENKFSKYFHKDKYGYIYKYTSSYIRTKQKLLNRNLKYKNK